jgi:hypothetical protein
MNIIIEEIVNNVTLQIEEVLSVVTIDISEMQTPGSDGKSAYQSALDGGFIGTELEFNAVLANTSGVNTGDQIIPTTLPASDVYAWAKEPVKPTYTKTEINLSNVDNTSDANKPISNSTAAALGNKADLVGGLILQSQLPSYVDDIINGYLFGGIFYNEVGHTTVIVGEIGKIYIDITTGQSSKQYRYTGAAYIQITNGLLASTNDLPEGVNNLYFTGARVLAALLSGISFATGGAIVSTDSILVAFGKLQKQISDNLTAIGLKANGSGTADGINTGDQDLSTYAKFTQVNTYALMIAIATPAQLTIIKVLNDENKGITNAIYHIYPDGVRMWIAANKDN